MVLASELRLMCVLAHPDDESLGTGGVLAKYAAEGVTTYLVTATRGERGRFGDSTESPGPEIVGKAREAELLAAARELGLREVRFLDYPDGALASIAMNCPAHRRGRNSPPRAAQNGALSRSTQILQWGPSKEYCNTSILPAGARARKQCAMASEAH